MADTPHPPDPPDAPAPHDAPDAPAPPTPPGAGEGQWATPGGAASPPPGRWVLRRSVRDRKLKGVAGGVAAAADIDPTLVRLLFAVAAFSGWGIVAYIVLALVLKDETAADPARPLPPDQRRPLRIGLGVAAFLAVGRLVGGSFFADGDLGLPLVLIAVGAAVLWARRDQGPTSAGADPQGVPPGGEAQAPNYAPGPWPASPPFAGNGIDWRSTAHDLLRLAAAFVAVGALLALVGGAFLVVVGAVPMRLPLLPAALGLAGVLGLVAAVVRRSRLAGLFVSGGVLVVAAALAVGLTSFPGGSAGTRIVAVGPGNPLLERYEHSAGRLVLDLRNLSLEPGDQRRVVAEVGTGQLTVIVPPAGTTTVRARVGTGAATLFGRAEGGPGLNVTARHDGGADAGSLDLDLGLGLGELRVELAPEVTSEVACRVPAQATGDGNDPVTCPHPARFASAAMACSVNLIGAEGGTGDGNAFCRRQGTSLPPSIGRFAVNCTVPADSEEAQCAPLSPQQREAFDGVRRMQTAGPPTTTAGPAAPPATTTGPVAGVDPLTCGPPDAAGVRTCTVTPAASTSTTAAPTYLCREQPGTGQLTCAPG